MRTYIPDQWLRLWFLGGQPSVNYSMQGQLQHSSPEQFSAELKSVWTNMESICASEAMMIVRFGGINDRKADPLFIIHQSFHGTSWKIDNEVSAGFSTQGKRQANHIRKSMNTPREEYDIWVKRG